MKISEYLSAWTSRPHFQYILKEFFHPIDSHAPWTFQSVIELKEVIFVNITKKGPSPKTSTDFNVGGGGKAFFKLKVGGQAKGGKRKLKPKKDFLEVGFIFNCSIPRGSCLKHTERGAPRIAGHIVISNTQFFTKQNPNTENSIKNKIPTLF